MGSYSRSVLDNQFNLTISTLVAKVLNAILAGSHVICTDHTPTSSGNIFLLYLESFCMWSHVICCMCWVW